MKKISKLLVKVIFSIIKNLPKYENIEQGLKF